MPRSLSPRTSLELLKKESKRLLRELRAGDADARARFERAYPNARGVPSLRDAQHALAREYGHASWLALKAAVEASSGGRESELLDLSTDAFERLVADLVAAFNERDQAALDRLNAQYQRTFTFDDLGAEVWRRVYSYRQRAFRAGPQQIHLPEAQTLVAQDAGFSSWAQLTQSAATRAPRPPAYEIDPTTSSAAPRRQLSTSQWTQLLAAMREQRVTTFDSQGLATDHVMDGIAGLEHLTTLRLGGSSQLTDAGLRHLARMPQLEHLELAGVNVTDKGLDVLRHLPNLRVFEMNWHRGISDAGVANLRFCERLERVDLMGSAVGDGVVEALAGKTRLRDFKSGRLLTDRGLRALPDLRALESLLVDGPFSDDGLGALAALTHLKDLDLFWHVTGMTSAGFAHLAALPKLQSLGADGKLSDDEAMRHYAAMPTLRMLRAQEAVASDEGFVALARSRSLEKFWGRECPGFGDRGFIAMSKMPTLRGLGVGCRNVSDAALAHFPHFAALIELTPIGVQDSGFRHIGRCERLERLTCMYCRDTTDVATAHIANLSIRYYYAGLTQITNESLAILGRMPALEQAEFYECRRITDEGLPKLAALPTLKEVHLDSCPGVTLAGTRVFPPHVRVKYST